MSSFEEWLKDLFKSKPIICENPEHDTVGFILSLFIAFGMAVSYFPQHLKIILNKSSRGLSGTYLFMGAISMIGLLSNTLLLQFGHFRCCAVQSAGQCFENLTSILTISIQFFCFMFYIVLYVVYFPREDRHTTNVFNHQIIKSRSYKKALSIAYITGLYLFVNILTTILLLVFRGDAGQDTAVEYFADANGLLSMILSTFQFIPQIIKTFKSGSIGALSIPTMLMQVPGSFILVYTLAIKPGSNLTQWITFFCTGCLQLILLVTCIYYYFRDRRAAKQPDEQPLLDEYSDSDETRASVQSQPLYRKFNPFRKFRSQISADENFKEQDISEDCKNQENTESNKD